MSIHTISVLANGCFGLSNRQQQQHCITYGFFYLLTKTYVLAISVPEAIPSICLKSYPKIKLHPNFWIGLGT